MNNQKQKDDNKQTASGSNNDSDNRIDAAAETTACSSNTSSTSSSSTNTRSTNSTTSSSSNKALEAPSTSTSTTQSADRPTASIAQSSNNNSRPGSSSSRPRSSSQQNQNRREVKRSTIKQLIESYFFQLQRGCGNPRCQNAYCASSGQVKQMTPNEAAAMALQLFSQDAQLCNSSDIHDENNTRGRHRRTGEQSHPADMHSPDSNSSHSTITLGSSADSTTSSTATSPSKSTTSLSEPQHLIPVLLNQTASSSSSLVYDCNGGGAAASTSSAAAKNNCSATTAAVLAASASDDANINGPPTPTHNAFPYLDVAIGIDLIEWCKRTQEFERLWQALDDVFSNVQRLNASFRLPKRRTLALEKKLEYTEDDVAATSSRYFTEIFGDISEAVAFADAVAEANAVKKLTNADADSVDENVENGVKELKSPEMSKEAQRALEGEIDKDEDSTQPETEGAIAVESTQNSNLTDTDIDSMSAQGPSTCYSSSGASSADPTDDADLRNPSHNLASGLPTIPDEENGAVNTAADAAHDINADLDTDASSSRPANRFSPSRDRNAAESLPENSNPDRQQQESSLSSTLFSRYFIDEPQWGGVNTEVDELFDWEFTSNSNIDIDFDGLRTFKQKLMDLQIPEYFEVMNMAMVQLCCSCSGYEVAKDWEKIMRCVVICFDIVTTSWMDMEFIDRAMPALCRVAAQLPVSTQARLARVWSVHGKDRLRSLVDTCQQLITLKVITEETDVQENPVVIAATKVLRIVYYASIMAGELDKPIPDHDNLCECGEPSTSGARAAHDFSLEDVLGINIPRHENRLEAMLGISAMDSRIPYVPFEEFYNEPLSDSIHMDKDYLAYKNLLMDPQREGQDLHFSFMCYSFILNPACKVIALYYDSRIRMYSERNSSLYSLLSLHSSDGDVRPDLRLKVRRDKLIHDALSGLEVVAMSNPKDLKKQLVVEFVGEQGIDEGGVSKEFFQLVIEEIFNPDIGMFVANEDSNTMWFNGAALESDSQFTLIGIILGLAIYNNIILAVNFPKVVYRKLMNGRGTYHDLRDFSPTLYRSMKQLLQYDQDDVEDVFMLTFKVSYVTVFGETLEYELKPGGGEMLVTKANKHEFVALYADFLLNKLVEKQFRAFKKGFDMVTDESPLKLLFRPEEIELLVCGSRKFDFKELEKSTEYEGGYTKDSQTIKDFWIVVHAMSNELKRKLLEFTTGSDRVPVGGFSRLKLLITRNGPDSDRLPTSHTCFNVLLLPEYSTKDKLEERLLKAINYSKGFGML